MKKHRIPFKFGLILLGTLFIICSAQANDENSSIEIERKILEQLGDQFELKRWDIVDVEEIAKGPATIEKFIIKITAIVKETLYQPAGRDENGQQTLRVSTVAGDPVEFQGYLIKAIIPGMAQQSPVQVVVAPGQPYGQPLSRFPSNAQTVAQKAPRNQPPSQPEPATLTSPPPARTGNTKRPIVF